MIERVVYPLRGEDLEQTKARAAAVAADTGLNTLVVEYLRLAWGRVSCPRGWYAPDGTYTDWSS